MLYEFHYKKLVVYLLPSFLRKVRMVAWLQATVKPINDLYQSFLLFRREKNIELNLQSQTLSVEKLLNDRFDNSLRRIYIENLDNAGVFVNAYLDIENQPRLNAYMQAEGQKVIANLQPESFVLDFIVFVPMALNQDVTLTAIRRVVEKYKYLSKQWKIELY